MKGVFSNVSTLRTPGLGWKKTPMNGLNAIYKRIIFYRELFNLKYST
jgi:hypothetical protein